MCNKVGSKSLILLSNLEILMNLIKIIEKLFI